MIPPRLASARALTEVWADRVEQDLARHEPHLAPLLRRELPGAMQIVSRRLLAAALREGLPTPAGIPVAEHGFGRLEPTGAVAWDPAHLADVVAGATLPPVRAELADATVNLALALARRSTVEPELLARARAEGATDMLELTQGMDADERCVAFERLSTEGHNLHPCGRTRLGWRVDDLLAHDLESPVTSVGFLAVHRDLHVGDEIGPEIFGAAGPAGLDPRRYAVTPVHPWQRRHVLRGRYADLHRQGMLVPLQLALPALVTSALRTLLVPGTGRYVKLSLDIQVTSTRRTISVASTRNGPVLSRLLPDLIADDRVLLMTETMGSAVVAPGTPARERDLSAIVRSGLGGRLEPGEVAIPGTALPARDPIAGRSVVAVLVDRFAGTRGIGEPGRAAHEFLAAYAELLLPPVLALATRFGVGLEAHLQNCLPTFVDGVPHRLAVRDLAGCRIHAPRLTRSVPSGPPPLRPGSVTITDDLGVMHAKVGYTALQAHLGEVIVQLVSSHGLDEARAWATVASTVEATYDALAAEPGLADRAAGDHAALMAPRVPHKALLSMRLRAVAGDHGDHYVLVRNALRGTA